MYLQLPALLIMYCYSLKSIDPTSTTLPIKSSNGTYWTILIQIDSFVPFKVDLEKKGRAPKSLATFAIFVDSNKMQHSGGHTSPGSNLRQNPPKFIKFISENNPPNSYA